MGPYRIERELGSGGMGRVFAAVVEEATPTLAKGTRVAVKVVHPHLLESPGTFKRFLREGELGKAIRHPNVVRTFDCDSLSAEGERVDFLVMELVEGQTLHALLEEMGTLPENLCRHVAREVASGLAAIHAAGIVHRDLKPENVLITSENVVKVMDLGVARAESGATRITEEMAFVGSLLYAAPEQLATDGVPIDTRADLYSLGVMLYELATGANPYRDTDWRVVLRRIETLEPRRLGSVNAQVSPFFEELVHGLIVKDRERRIGSARELGSILERGEESSWWGSRAKSLRRTTRRALRRIKIPRESALVGRAAELATLRAAYERARSGAGQVVLLEGEAGIGKSRLVDELVAMLQSEGEDLDFLFGSYPPGGAATAGEAFTTAYREHFGEEDLDEALAAPLEPAPLLIPGFAALLTGQLPPPGALALSRDAVQTCFVLASRAIAAERTAVVLIDDLHFAPEEGRALFAALAMAVLGHRVLLVGTSRPPVEEKWVADMTRIGHVTRLAVGRLGPKDLVALLGDALRSTHLAEELAYRIAEKTDGNPYFVFEVLRGLRDGHYLRRNADGSWSTTRTIREIRIPSTIADLIQARVSTLGDDERVLLEIAACIGFEFDPALVGDVAGLPRIALLKALGSIEKAHRLIRASGRRYVFDHHQVQEQLHAGLSEFVKEGYHAAIAESLERMTGATSADPAALDGALCADLCEHALKGAAGGRSVRYRARAQSHLLHVGANARAAEITRRALDVPGLLGGRERAVALLDLAECANRMGRSASEEDSIREAAKLADESGEAKLRIRVASTQAVHLIESRRFPEADEALARARALGLETGDMVAVASADKSLGVRFYYDNQPERARECWERAESLARELGNAIIEAGCTVNFGNSYRKQGRMIEAVEHYTRGLARCRAIGHVGFEAIALRCMGAAQRVLGRLDEARAGHLRALALDRSLGNRTLEVGDLMYLAYVALEEGDLVATRENVQTALALAEEIADRRLESHMRYFLAMVLADTGDEAAALEQARLSRDMADEIGSRTTLVMADCLLARFSPENVARAEATLAAHGEQCDSEEMVEALWWLWLASGSREHLDGAKAVADGIAAGLGDDAAALAHAGGRIPRAVIAAWRERAESDRLPS